MELFMEGSKLDIVEQNTAGPLQFFLFGDQLFLAKAVLNFEHPLLPGFGAFDNTNDRAHCHNECHHPFVVKLIHGSVD